MSEKTVTPNRPVQPYLEGRLRKWAGGRLFWQTSLNMGWQMALAVLLPVLIGSRLDNRYHSYPLWSLTGLAAGVSLAIAAAWRAVRSAKIPPIGGRS